MKGSVTKYKIAGSSRPRWRYRVDAGKDEQGQRIQEGRGGFAKEGEARDAMKSHMEEIAGRATRKERIEPDRALGTWLTEWLNTYAPDRCQPKTLERYRQLAKYLPPELCAITLKDLSHREIEPALFGLLKIKGKRREHISARTVRHVASLLHVALNKAFKLELININPMLRVELPVAEKRDARSLTLLEIRSFREACRADWTFALIELALGSGARRGELLALTWDDIDWTAHVLRINKSIEQTEAGLRLKRPKGGKTRNEKLPQSAITALQFHLEQQREHKRLFGADYKDLNLIFCEPDGSHLEPDLVSQVVIRRMRKAGIKDASIQTLRHTHGSHLLSRGVPLPAVSARLGHADVNVTARVYSHALPADDERAAAAWDSIDSPIQ